MVEKTLSQDYISKPNLHEDADTKGSFCNITDFFNSNAKKIRNIVNGDFLEVYTLPLCPEQSHRKPWNNAEHFCEVGLS